MNKLAPILTESVDPITLEIIRQLLQSIPDESIDLIYIDPPFNTGRSQQRSKETTR